MSPTLLPRHNLTYYDREIQVDEFVDLVKSSGLENDLLLSGNNVTIFVPSNDAIEDFRHDMEEVFISR